MTDAVPNATVTTFDIHGSAPDDIWIVGERRVGVLPQVTYHNYSAHFDGQSWTTVEVPSIDLFGSHNELGGVVSISPTEAYAAGDTKWGGTNQVQIFRWDGTVWELEALNVIDETGTGNDMGIAGDELWVVGDRTNNDTPPAASGRALALRRTDSGWVEEFVPMLAAFGRATNSLQAIDGVSSDDAWAVGHARQVYTPGPSFGFSRYIVHWDGSEWTLDTSLPFKELSEFSDIQAIAHDDVWAVGYEVYDNKNHPMITHFDGTAWTQVELDPLPNSALLRGIAASSPTEIHALGVQTTPTGDTVPLILRYDGTSWTEIQAGTIDGFGAQFMDAFGFEDGPLWGVGIYVNPDHGPLTQRYECAESDCLPDTNRDGLINPADFTSWIAAFNANGPTCDQNGDAQCTPTDFTSWIANINAGC